MATAAEEHQKQNDALLPNLTEILIFNDFQAKNGNNVQINNNNNNNDDSFHYQIKMEEIFLIVLVFLLWIFAILLFFNRWGKIRMLEPYQPKFVDDSRRQLSIGAVDTSSTCQQHNLSKFDSKMSNINCTSQTFLQKNPRMSFSKYNVNALTDPLSSVHHHLHHPIIVKRQRQMSMCVFYPHHQHFNNNVNNSKNDRLLTRRVKSDVNISIQQQQQQRRMSMMTSINNNNCQILYKKKRPPSLIITNETRSSTQSPRSFDLTAHQCQERQRQQRQINDRKFKKTVSLDKFTK